MSAESLNINENALKILDKRKYLWHKEDGTKETPSEMFWRVCNFVSKAEVEENRASVAQKFYDITSTLRFVPNTPTLLNAGRERGQLAACFVLPIGDSMEDIMDTLKAQALVQKSGGGTGFSFDVIRESGALIKSTQMKAAGPISVIKFMNYMMSEFIIQGGTRHGANMGVLPVDHPDVLEFITFKEKDGSCKSFNVSIAATDEFMHAVLEGGFVELKSRVNGEVVKRIPAQDIFNLACQYAWATGDPGLLFIDAANRANPTPHIGRLEATNPCGEQWLLPDEACTLGHINLSKYFIPHPESNGSWMTHVNWDLMAHDIEWGVRFLDNVIEVNHYPLSAVEKMHRYTNRKIGLGVMGLADLLIMLGIPYASLEAQEVSDVIAHFHRTNADAASVKLGKERGSFGAFKGSALEGLFEAIRNACRTTVAPTGTTAIVAGCSTGIEPIFALILKREQAGMILYEIHPLFEKFLNTLNAETRMAVIDYYFEHNSIQGCPNISSEMAALFMQANDVNVDGHIKMQAVWQRHVDNSISKTINMPNSATVEDVKKAYLDAWKLGCKGITVYRDGCRAHQALSVAKPAEPVLHLTPEITVPAPVELVDGATQALCKECGAALEISGGCETCKSCGYAACSI